MYVYCILVRQIPLEVDPRGLESGAHYAEVSPVVMGMGTGCGIFDNLFALVLYPGVHAPLVKERLVF